MQIYYKELNLCLVIVWLYLCMVVDTVVTVRLDIILSLSILWELVVRQSDCMQK